MSVAPTLDTPNWVAGRVAAWNQLISGASGELSLAADSLGSGRTFDFPGMTPAAVANQLNRINNTLELAPDVGSAASPAAVPQLQFVSDPDAFVNLDDQGRRIPTPGTVPNPGSTLETAPAPPPVPVNPLNEPPVPVPGVQPQQQTGPDTSLLDMPDTGGRPEGSTWDGKMLDGRPVKYVIPQGNGSNTVDLEITNPNGTIDHWRIASDGHGGLQHWHDDADGNSSYASRTDPSSNWYVQSFQPGTSTAGAPSHDLEATATFKRVFTPSYDANGNRVGTDVGTLNKFGLYDNNHVDNYGNLTITTARPDGKGGVTSSFIKQLDSNSWRYGTDGEIWEMGTDLRGHTTYGRTEMDDEGTHSFLISDNVLYDSFYGKDRGLGSHTDKYNSDGTITRTIPNGPTLLLRRDGSHTVLREAPGGYDDVTKALMTGRDVLKGMGSSLKTWGTDLLSTFDFRPGLMAAANPMNQGYQAAAAEHFQRTNAAAQAPIHLLIIDPAETLLKKGYYTFSGALWGMTGDPITPSGRIRAQQGIDQMNKAPSDFQTLLAASAFFFPESAAARAGGVAALHGADLVVADLAAAATRKPLAQLAGSTMWSGTNALKFELIPATKSGLGAAEVALGSGLERWTVGGLTNTSKVNPAKIGSNFSITQVIPGKATFTTFDLKASAAQQAQHLNQLLRTSDEVSRTAANVIVKLEQHLRVEARTSRPMVAANAGASNSSRGASGAGHSSASASHGPGSGGTGPASSASSASGSAHGGSGLGSGGSVASSSRPALPPGRARLSMRQIRNIKDPEKFWRAGEEFTEAAHPGSIPQKLHPVPKNNHSTYPVTTPGGRRMDFTLPLPNGGTLFIEVKTYRPYLPIRLKNPKGTPKGTPPRYARDPLTNKILFRRNEVPASPGIKEEVSKDLALKYMHPNNQLMWVFIEAGPSAELREYLLGAGVTIVEHI